MAPQWKFLREKKINFLTKNVTNLPINALPIHHFVRHVGRKDFQLNRLLPKTPMPLCK